MKKSEKAESVEDALRKLLGDRDALLVVAKRVLAETTMTGELMEYLKRVIAKVEEEE